MAKYGFTVYGVEPAPEPTIPEILATLSGEQKVKILEGFAEDGRPLHWRQWVKESYPEVDRRVPRRVIVRLYEEIQAIQEWCRVEMRGERVETPEVRDPETGEVTQEAQYNTPPSGIVALRAAAGAAFQEFFTAAQVTAVVNMMVAYSAPGASGDWTHYSTYVVQ